ncbi:MAG TPA: erythromycin esterase family protein, partial [Gemmatimonadales bacterium]
MHAPVRSPAVHLLLREAAERFTGIAEVQLGSLLERIGEARVVLLGEATHGSSEFYRMRARITRELIERKGFSIVAVEADWPDAAWVDRYVRHAAIPPAGG